MIHRLHPRALRGAILAALLGAGCGDTPSTGPGEPAAVPVRLAKVLAREGPCGGGWCRFRIVVSAAHRDTGEPLAARLRVNGSGRWSPGEPATALPDGRGEFHWDFPQRDGSHALKVCPEPAGAGACLAYTATLSGGGGLGEE
ncbi:MAG TPA: hypothetical protein VF263_02690 [Longimicrobiaceae bacterium]